MNVAVDTKITFHGFWLIQL